MSVTPLELARIAAAAADDKKASDVVLLDLTKQSDVCDYFLVCTASNRRLSDAVVEEIEAKVLANSGAKPLSIEGREESTWVLMDYGSVVVHVFLPETRDYYRLERLWGDAPRVELGLGEGARPTD
ncbi:MAG: ribosome silencing factor [Atopobiaceae bacterium]|jgi:ribosome-associated protein|nr:ribosome silencing factor [Atopobiaceae bacterium]